MNEFRYYGTLQGYQIEYDSIILDSTEDKIIDRSEFLPENYQYDQIVLGNIEEINCIEAFIDNAIGEDFSIEYLSELNMYQLYLTDHFDQSILANCEFISISKNDYTILEWMKKYHQLESTYYKEIESLSSTNQNLNRYIHELRGTLKNEYNKAFEKEEYFKKRNSENAKKYQFEQELLLRILNKLDFNYENK